MKPGPLVQQIKGILLRRRDALRRSLSGEWEHVSLLDEHVVGDSADAARDADYREINSGLIAVESRELAHIERALERLRLGRYGICESCGKKIPVSRLKALPYATLCVQCQTLQEQGRSKDATVHDGSRFPQTPRGWEYRVSSDNLQSVD